MADPGSTGRYGSWLPMWRVAGALFIAYPVVRIIMEPPAPIVVVAALTATTLFALLVLAVGRAAPTTPVAGILRSPSWSSRSSPSRR